MGAVGGAAVGRCRRGPGPPPVEGGRAASAPSSASAAAAAPLGFLLRRRRAGRGQPARGGTARPLRGRCATWPYSPGRGPRSSRGGGRAPSSLSFPSPLRLPPGFPPPASPGRCDFTGPNSPPGSCSAAGGVRRCGAGQSRAAPPSREGPRSNRAGGDGAGGWGGVSPPLRSLPPRYIPLLRRLRGAPGRLRWERWALPVRWPGRGQREEEEGGGGTPWWRRRLPAPRSGERSDVSPVRAPPRCRDRGLAPGRGGGAAARAGSVLPLR